MTREPDAIRELTDDGALVLALARPDTLNSLGGTIIPDVMERCGKRRAAT